jgi:hypothetical protein
VSRAVRLLAVAAALALGACGGGESEDDEVTSALQHFVTVVKKDDAAGYCKGVTPATQRLFAKVSEGVDGRRGSCERLIGRVMKKGTSGLTDKTREAIDDADVEVDGSTATVTDGRVRLPMRKVDDTWRLDIANFPEEGYGLRTTAACTENKLRGVRRPLPAATRPGLAREAKAQAAEYTHLLRAIDRIKPPRGERESHETLLRILRAQRATWSQTAKRLRGFGAPLKTFNRALKTSARRAKRIESLRSDLQFSCLGNALTLRSARDYRRNATAACRGAYRRFKRLGKPTAANVDTFIGRFQEISRRLRGRLRSLRPPALLRRLHRQTVTAFGAVAAELPRLSRSTGKGALEHYELLILRSSVGFFRLGLPRCGEL